MTAAREFLAAVTAHQPAALPPSALRRECAELRRRLADVLDVIAAPAAATPAGPVPELCGLELTVLQALRDAITLRAARASVEDADQAGMYAYAGRRLLGTEVRP